MQERLRARCCAVATLNIADIHGTKDLKTEKTPLKIEGLHSKVNSVEAFAHLSIALRNKSLNLTDVGIIHGEDVYELQHQPDYMTGKEVNLSPF